MYKSQEYTEKSDKVWGFPSHNVSPETKKSLTWCRQWAEAIHSLYLRDRCSIPYSKRGFFANLRAYGAGCQDVNIYKPILLQVSQDELNKDPNLVNKGYLNVKWDIFSVAPKFKEVILGMFENMEHDIIPQAIDEYSGDEKETAKWKLWVEKEYKPYFAAIEAELGIKSAEPNYLPESMQELELFAEMGGIKLKTEIAMQKIISDNEQSSNWVEVKRKIIEDLIDLRFAACKDYVDPKDHKVKTKYIDVTRAGCQYSRTWNFDNSNYAFHYEEYTVAQLRVLTNIPEDELAKLALNNCGLNGNPLSDRWTMYNMYNTVTNSYGYDDFLITVGEFEWYSTDQYYKTTRKAKNGYEFTFPDTYGKVRDTENKKTSITKVNMVYQCKWIVGTEHCFDYGLMEDIPRAEKYECRYSYHFYKLPGEKSFTERLIPNYDAIQIAWLKLQNANATAPPDGLSIEVGSLNNISLGGGKTVQPFDIMRMRMQNGNVIWKATTHTGRLTSMGKPIEPLPGGMGKSAQDALMVIDINLNYIAELIGIDRISSVSGQTQEQSATQTKLAVAATGNSLKPMYAGYLEIKKSLATNVCLRSQLLIKYFPESYEAYMPVIGKGSVDVLKFAEDVAACKYGIYMEPRATDADKQDILLAAIEAMKVGKNGEPQIDYEDYVMIKSMIDTGQLRYARAILAYKTRKKAREQKQREQENITANTQAAIATSSAKTADEIKLIEAKANADIKVEAYKALFASTTQEVDFIRSIAEKGMDAAMAPPAAPGAAV